MKKSAPDFAMNSDITLDSVREGGYYL